MSKIIELIKHRITPMDSEKGEENITRTFHKDDYKSLDAVIEALEQGEKHKKMWDTFMDKWNKITDDYIFHNKKIDKKEIKQLDDFLFNLKN